MSVGPVWLQWDSHQAFFLHGDDFVYLAGSRTFAETIRSLFRPHNAHVVPLFRLWTWGLVAVSGSMAAWPTTALLMCYATFVGAILAVGHVVSWESRRLSWGLAAMAGVGCSTVLLPTVAWYSAGQALLAGLMGLAMLGALQFWRRGGRLAWLILATLGAFAAPWLWSGGYVAGLAGSLYLWLDGRREARRVAWLPLAASFAVLGVSLALAGRGMFTAERPEPGGPARAANPVAGLSHTAQAIPEVLILPRFGLDATTTPAQGIGLCLLLLFAWGWSRGWRSLPTPLEGAGAIFVAGGFGLAYTFRGYYPFENLRGIYWYQAIPELGAFLFAAGWALAVIGDRGLPGPPARPKLREALAIVGMMALLMAVQAPRAGRMLQVEIPPASEAERRALPPDSDLLRARALGGERAERQARFLARLDRADRLARAEGLDRATLRAALGRSLGTGLPSRVADLDALSLLRLPDSGGNPPRPETLRTLREWLAPEPIVRPMWLPSGEPWSPRDW